jgi:hypothetical protein
MAIKIIPSPAAEAAIERPRTGRSYSRAGTLVAGGAIGILVGAMTGHEATLASIATGPLRLVQHVSRLARGIVRHGPRGPRRFVAGRAREHRSGRMRLRRGPPSDDPAGDPEPPRRLSGRAEVAR